ncbi:DUF2812 domain-containing protein [Mangrovibacillus cuniculi]|uniref:DUF2812 domain-containing protein n=1 Tax=Mangrovibacillus cuniculi TaxID=2593652 RepID=A0A7S8C8U1_9BACI|nr:DUF2812 domain-containing protein [Mangrovibacillus cuniculi]QPC45525.1 DUF2812 domain-containing protein [Mangrovibacillus cuniculi]
MDKHVYKLRPSDYWKIGEHESWFSDMAAEGLHLKKIGVLFAKFAKGEPKDMNYRIELTSKRYISSEQKQFYQENGWDYVAKYGMYHIFASPVKVNAPELHTDPAEQAYTLTELDKKLKSNAITSVVAAIFLTGMLGANLFLDGTPFLQLIDGGLLHLNLISLFLIFATYQTIIGAKSIHTLKKDLAAGKSIDHRAKWSKNSKRRTIISLLFTILLLFSSIVPFYKLVQDTTETLPESTPSLPIVRLAEIENNPNLLRQEPEYFGGDDVDWANRLSISWDPLAPVQYETDENGYVPGEQWADQSGEYSPSLSTEYYQLQFSFLAEPLLNDLRKRNHYPGRGIKLVHSENKSFDTFYAYEEQESKEVYASIGNVVVYVRYHGFAKIEDIIIKMEEKVTLMEL